MDKFRIIIVEDEVDYQKIFKRDIDKAILNSEFKVEVICFKDYSDGLNALYQNYPWHLLITDIWLRQIGELKYNTKGKELCGIAHELGIPCIATSQDPIVDIKSLRDLFKIYHIEDFFDKLDLDHDTFQKVIVNEIKKYKIFYEEALNAIGDNSELNVIRSFIDENNPFNLHDTLYLIKILFPNALDKTGVIELYRLVKKSIAETIINLEKNNDLKYLDRLKNIEKLLNKPDLDIKQGIKLTIPIIPFLLNYEGIIEINIKKRIAAIYNKLKKK